MYLRLSQRYAETHFQSLYRTSSREEVRFFKRFFALHSAVLGRRQYRPSSHTHISYGASRFCSHKWIRSGLFNRIRHKRYCSASRFSRAGYGSDRPAEFGAGDVAPLPDLRGSCIAQPIQQNSVQGLLCRFQIRSGWVWLRPSSRIRRKKYCGASRFTRAEYGSARKEYCAASRFTRAGYSSVRPAEFVARNIAALPDSPCANGFAPAPRRARHRV